MKAFPSKIPELTWLRGFAAISVVLYHYTTRYYDVYGVVDKWFVNVSWGCGAVNTFFILSGFLTALTLRKNTSALCFIRKRAVRLYPTYWVCIILTTLAMLFLMPSKVVGLADLAINFTMFQGFVGVKAVDGVYWTVRYELQFYIYVAQNEYVKMIYLLILSKKKKWKLLI